MLRWLSPRFLSKCHLCRLSEGKERGPWGHGQRVGHLNFGMVSVSPGISVESGLFYVGSTELQYQAEEHFPEVPDEKIQFPPTGRYIVV